MLRASYNAQPFVQYLEACHGLSRAIRVVNDRTLTTQGETTNPTGRIFPHRILHWLTFAANRQRVWKQLADSPSFHSQQVFPTLHQLDYISRNLEPISSKVDFSHYERDTVENPVRQLVNEMYNDQTLRKVLQMKGSATFERHTNLGSSPM